MGQKNTLDNMDPSKLSEKLSCINNSFETEASGNINEKNLIQYAETGVDFISMGALTYCKEYRFEFKSPITFPLYLLYLFI